MFAYFICKGTIALSVSHLELSITVSDTYGATVCWGTIFQYFMRQYFVTISAIIMISKTRQLLCNEIPNGK